MMNQNKTLNHLIQKLSLQDLNSICSSYDVEMNDSDLKIILSIIHNNPSTIIDEDYYPILYITIGHKLDTQKCNIFKPLIENRYILKALSYMKG